jgi:hypothetical protein
MIGLVYILRRLPNLSLEEFQRYWRETHGPLVAGHANSLGISRYIQDHKIEDPINDVQKKLRSGPDPYDGIDELWWNYRAEPAKALATTEGKRVYQELVEDERKFIDFSNSALAFVIEVPQINSAEKIVATKKSTILKRTGVLRKLPNLSLEEAQLHWRTDHATLIRSFAPITHIRRYIQLHMIEFPLTDSLRAMRGKMGEPFEGIVTSWIDRLLTAGAEVTPEYKQAYQEIVKDELNFIDLPRGGMWVNKEYVFVDR